MSPAFGGLGRDALASIKNISGLAHRLGAHAPSYMMSEGQVGVDEIISRGWRTVCLGAHAPSHMMSEGQVGVDNSNLGAQDGTAALGARAMAIRRGRMKLNERTHL
jgi:hypothetical protein